MIQLRPFLPVLVLVVGLSACSENSRRGETIPMDVAFEKEGELDFLRPDGSVITSIDIEIADTPESREQGLMHRRSLASDRGMLFIFPDESSRGFWMKNTYISLDIVFADADSQVVSIARRTRIMSEESIEPAAPKQYVVEVRAGFCNRFGIDTNSRIRWRRTEATENSFLQQLWPGLLPLPTG